MACYDFDAEELKCLNLLSVKYPTYKDACTEIINLQAIINLPKGTEHFVSDIHGEFDSFNHVLKNASGVIKNHIRHMFGSSLRETDIKSLSTLIYYPNEKLRLIKESEKDIYDWYKITLFRLVKVCKKVASKYTRSKVRKSIPKEYAYILEELIHEDGTLENKQGYYNNIIDSIIELNRADDYIIAIANVIQRLAIDRLHILGDIYDRGPAADEIMELLRYHHSLDIQWGNHDICWMGASLGSLACILNVLRISARYANLDTVQEGYGINLDRLFSFAEKYYGNDKCDLFLPESSDDKKISLNQRELLAKFHKAVCLLQFKIEAQVIKRHPEYLMDDRLVLDKINFNNKTVVIEGKEYKLIDSNFPLVNPNDCFEITQEENDLLTYIKHGFVTSAKLRRHVDLLFEKGSMYKIFNNNLMFHGCLPMTPDGQLKEVEITGKKLKGKELLDEIENLVRKSYRNIYNYEASEMGLDLMWYLWCGSNSPLFGKDKMTTFERYFIADESSHTEKKDPYFEYRNKEEYCNGLLESFGLKPDKAHIVNGHVPVKVMKGESPIKANGKLFVIDGGFAKAYQRVTGIAGYTLIYNSYGLVLVSHEPFESKKRAIEEEIDIRSSYFVLEYNRNRISVGDTDIGKGLKLDIDDLKKLLVAYEKGLIPERKI